MRNFTQTMMKILLHFLPQLLLLLLPSQNQFYQLVTVVNQQKKCTNENHARERERKEIVATKIQSSKSI
jgi:hypothetical protein